MPELWLPRHLRPAQKRIAVVFYQNPKTQHIIVGFPEQFPIPPAWAKIGYQKYVCRSAAEVDQWDKKLRDQERRENEMTDEQREAIEGPVRQYVRQELIHKMMNSRNPVNREFCRQALAKLDADEERKKMKRESFMHIVGFEDGK